LSCCDRQRGAAQPLRRDAATSWPLEVNRQSKHIIPLRVHDGK
jgi:hypothetical protein